MFSQKVIDFRVKHNIVVKAPKANSEHRTKKNDLPSKNLYFTCTHIYARRYNLSDKARLFG